MSRKPSRYLLVLVGRDGGEDGLREAEGLDPLPGGDGLVGGQLAAEVLPDDVHAGLVLVHGVEDDLERAENTRLHPHQIEIISHTFIYSLPDFPD